VDGVEPGPCGLRTCIGICVVAGLFVPPPAVALETVRAVLVAVGPLEGVGLERPSLGVGLEWPVGMLVTGRLCVLLSRVRPGLLLGLPVELFEAELFCRERKIWKELELEMLYRMESKCKCKCKGKRERMKEER
jgi:hypothetical protein